MELPLLENRRSLLWVLGLLALGMVIAGCQQANQPPPAEKPAATDQETKATPPSAAEPASVKPGGPTESLPAEEGKEKPAPKDDAEEEAFDPGPPPAAALQASKPDAAANPPADEEDAQPKRRDLGPPLVENVEKLSRLHPADPVWFDPQHKSVVMVGEVCQRRTPLELFACLRGSKEHESVVSVATKAFVVHAGLLAAGVEPGNPVQFHPEYIPARGPEVEVTVIWKDEKGQVRRARGQEWVRNMRTQKAMEYPWVFAGSQFVKNEQTGEQLYRADGEGDLICVSNFPSAVLDIPVKSSDANTDLMYECFTENIPPAGTPVTLVLTPKPVKPAEESAKPAQEAKESVKPAEPPKTAEDPAKPAKAEPTPKS